MAQVKVVYRRDEGEKELLVLVKLESVDVGETNSVAALGREKRPALFEALGKVEALLDELHTSKRQLLALLEVCRLNEED